MAQLRRDYQKFTDLNTKIMVIVPNGPKMIKKHVLANHTPYTILTDKGCRVAAQYTQLKQLFVLGTPTVFLVDRTGRIRYTHYASSLAEEPDSGEPLAVLAQLAA
jgi:peroxiredoxin